MVMVDPGVKGGEMTEFETREEGAREKAKRSTKFTRGDAQSLKDKEGV